MDQDAVKAGAEVVSSSAITFLSGTVVLLFVGILTITRAWWKEKQNTLSPQRERLTKMEEAMVAIGNKLDVLSAANQKNSYTIESQKKDIIRIHENQQQHKQDVAERMSKQEQTNSIIWEELRSLRQDIADIPIKIKNLLDK